MDSILSTEERKVAAAIRQGATIKEIATEQNKPAEAIERAVERIREKTGRALATLVESPFTAEVAAGRPEAERERLADALDIAKD